MTTNRLRDRVRAISNRYRDPGRRVLISTGVGFVVAALYVIIAPDWYEAQLAVVPQMSSKSSSGGGLAAAAGAALGGELPIDLNLGGPPSASDEKIQAVLKSRSVADA